jgi:UDP-N-acetylmuramoyl-tripeptide--D-alanyl-D-alanine ligase
VVELNLSEIAKKTGGEILRGSPATSFQTYNIDSRLSQPGELFFALKAERDGHAFIPDAAGKGAAGAVISQSIAKPFPEIALIRVKNTLLALQELAASVLDSHPVKVVGITGSIGKTTTKEFTAALLDPRYDVLKSEGNYNNHIGVPLTILKIQRKNEVIVLEMGMSAPGEIKRLTQIAPPDIAVITNIHPVHLEFFAGVDEIALAKKEILDGMNPTGTAVLNGDDPAVERISKDLKGGKLLFGLSTHNDIRAENIRRIGHRGLSLDLVYGGQKENTTIPFVYKSFLYNYLAAAAVASTLAIPLADILSRTADLQPFPMRGEIHTLRDGILLIDDSYNSNPAALESALKDLAELDSTRKVAVLGDMLELGITEVSYHREAGKQVKQYAWDVLITVGPLSRYMAEGALEGGMEAAQITSFADADEAANHVVTLLEPGDLVLVKGSRGTEMDKIVSSLMTRRN